MTVYVQPDVPNLGPSKHRYVTANQFYALTAGIDLDWFAFCFSNRTQSFIYHWQQTESYHIDCSVPPRLRSWLCTVFVFFWMPT